MVVRQDDPPDARRAELGERFLPAGKRAGRPEAGVDDRPALRILDRVAVDVVERPGQPLGDTVDTSAEIRRSRRFALSSRTFPEASRPVRA